MASLAVPLLVGLASVSFDAFAAGPTPSGPTKLTTTSAATKAAVREEDDSIDTGGAGPSDQELSASRAEYAAKLQEMHKTRPMRKREHLEEAQYKYRRILEVPGFEGENKTHVERLARLRRLGGLAVAEQREYDVRMEIFSLIVRELDRHRAVIRDLEKKAKEPS